MAAHVHCNSVVEYARALESLMQEWRSISPPLSQSYRSPAKRKPRRRADIIDIREYGQPLDLAPSIRSGLLTPQDDGLRSLPHLLLWNEQGLRNFEEETHTPQHYLTNTEIALLEDHSQDIARNVQPGTIILGLGSGYVRKINILLKAMDALGKEVDYYALDLDENELQQTLRQLPRFHHIRCHGLLGTHEDGQIWLSGAENAQRPRCVLSLGSSLGSFTRPEAGAFLRNWASALQPGEYDLSQTGPAPQLKDAQLIIALDACKDPHRVSAAYDYPRRANACFILDALDHANRHLGYEAFDRHDWTVQDVWCVRSGRHEQYLVPLTDVVFEGTQIKKGEEVMVVQSRKYCEEERRSLWSASGLTEVERYESGCGDYGMLCWRHRIM